MSREGILIDKPLERLTSEQVRQIMMLRWRYYRSRDCFPITAKPRKFSKRQGLKLLKAAIRQARAGISDTAGYRL
jgi:hypothetical protein